MGRSGEIAYLPNREGSLQYVLLRLGDVVAHHDHEYDQGQQVDELGRVRDDELVEHEDER